MLPGPQLPGWLQMTLAARPKPNDLGGPSQAGDPPLERLKRGVEPDRTSYFLYVKRMRFIWHFSLFIDFRVVFYSWTAVRRLPSVPTVLSTPGGSTKASPNTDFLHPHPSKTELLLNIYKQTWSTIQVLHSIYWLMCGLKRVHTCRITWGQVVCSSLG